MSPRASSCVSIPFYLLATKPVLINSLASRYDRDFLLQFRTVCQEMPERPHNLDALRLRRRDQSTAGLGVARNGSRRCKPDTLTPSASDSRDPFSYGHRSGKLEYNSNNNSLNTSGSNTGSFRTPVAPLQVNRFETAETKAKVYSSIASVAHSEDRHIQPSIPSPMSKEAAMTNIAENTKEFFCLRLLDNAEMYFSQLPEEHRFRLVRKLTWIAIRSKVADALLVADLFIRARVKNLCNAAWFEEGFRPLAELLDDIAVDAPNAYDLFSVLMKSAGLDKDDERRMRIVKLVDSGRLVQLL